MGSRRDKTEMTLAENVEDVNKNLLGDVVTLRDLRRFLIR